MPFNSRSTGSRQARSPGALRFLDEIDPPMDGLPEPDPLMQPIPNATKPKAPPGMTEETPAGVVDPNTGAEMLPNTAYPDMREDVDPSMVGNEDATSWDQPARRTPVYEWQGRRWVGDLRWMPELPQDLQPVDWILVPVSGAEWKQS